jgi:MSHA biogenesis protein MshN
MSVINQLLIDLERRRASHAERSLIPNHVRALPQAPARPGTIWLAGGGGMLLAALAAWVAVSGGVGSTSIFKFGRDAGMPPAQPIRGSAVAPAAPASVRPATAEETVAATITSTFQPAGRLSFELSTLPAATGNVARQPERENPQGGIASSRVIRRAQDPAPAAPVRKTQPAGGRAAAQNVQSDAAVAPPEIDKRVRQPTEQQLAEGEYRRATVALHAGRGAEARAGFEAALKQYPQHLGARQALFGVLIEAKEMQEAERILQEGLDLAPNQIGFAMAMARLQVDRGDVTTAIGTLRRSAGHAAGSADYAAFLAALLHREKRYAEAVDQFVAALRLKPNTGVWLLGLGMALEALDRNAEAREAFTRARATGSLNPSLQAFVDERLTALR